MAKPKLAALLTDFGSRDPFVGVMKGVILERAPKAALVDLTHGIDPQNVSQASFHLRACAGYFPKNTLFVCVVDPGVGSERRIVWARDARHQYLAPDNGLLTHLDAQEVRIVSNSKLFRHPVSATFHGRDIFAAVAGSLLQGTPASSLGPATRRLVQLPGGDRPRVVHIDRFGNAVTDLSGAEVRPGSSLRVKGKVLGPLRKTFSSVASGKPLAYVGSWGTVEFGQRDGNLSVAWGIRPGDLVSVK